MTAVAPPPPLPTGSAGSGGYRHASTYGYRAKLGLIVPPTNTVNEAEWARMVPEGVTFHTRRMALHADVSSAEGKRALHDDLDRAISDLRQARVDVVAYACTAGSMITPARQLPEEVGARNEIAVTTTAAAIVAALAHLGVHRISIATPYHDALNHHEVEFLAAHGIETLRIEGLGIGAGGPAEYVRIAETPLAAVEQHARDAFVAGSDALLITCTDFPSLPLIERLERSLGVPVVTSNQATLWSALRTAGIDDCLPATGRLFQAGPV